MMRSTTFPALTKIIAIPSGRDLIAIGCTEGVWIGFRHDSQCMGVSASVVLPPHSRFLSSYATGVGFTNGDSMRRGGRIWYLPRACRQGWGCCSLIANVLLMIIAVPDRLQHRRTRAPVTRSSRRFVRTPRTQPDQGRTVF